MARAERPFPLLLLAFAYFVLGLSALFAVLKGEFSESIGMVWLVVSYAIVMRRSWSLPLLKVLVGIECAVIGLFLILMLFTRVLNLSDMITNQRGTLILFSQEIDVQPWIAFAMIFVFLLGWSAFQIWVAFSPATAADLKNSER